MNEELKPCPFCGAAGRLADAPSPRGGEGERECSVICERDWDCCGVHDTPEAAIAEWNTRPQEDALRARVAELEAKAAIADSVPWSAISRIVSSLAGYDYPVDLLAKSSKEFSEWFVAHAPKGDAA